MTSSFKTFENKKSIENLLFALDEGLANGNSEIANPEKNSPFHVPAAKNNRVKIIDILSSYNPDVDSTNSLKYSFFEIVIREEYSRVAKMLLANGADVNVASGTGDTPLHWAVYDNAELVKVLIKKGANVNAENKRKITPLFNATASYNHNNDIKVEIIRILIKNGANVNEIHDNGNTLLHLMACGDPSAEIVKVFIENGANVNTVNEFGDTPLHLAVKNKKTEKAKLLIDSGANVNITNKDGYTPLDPGVFGSRAIAYKFY